MTIANVGGGSQIGDGNVNEVKLGVQFTPPTATSTATLTVAQLMGGILLGSPSSTAATYTLPTVALTEAALGNAKNYSSFDLAVVNVDGSGSGVITMAVGTGWTAVGLMTVAATAGTATMFRMFKTGTGAWTICRIAE